MRRSSLARNIETLWGKATVGTINNNNNNNKQLRLHVPVSDWESDVKQALQTAVNNNNAYYRVGLEQEDSTREKVAIIGDSISTEINNNNNNTMTSPFVGSGRSVLTEYLSRILVRSCLQEGTTTNY